MNRAGRRPGALTERVIEQRLWGESPFFLLDVGCSGGVEQHWHVLGDRLRAVGFDPLVAEIDRLSAIGAHPGITYEAAFVTCRDYDRLFPLELRNDPVASRSDEPFPRVSAAAAHGRLEVSFAQQQFNAGAPLVASDRTVVLDEFVEDHQRAQVDFVKVDTDGHDIEAVLGAQAIMAAGGVLGLKVEVQFHGATHPFANTFGNIDRVLRQRGFSLFGLTTYQYSRKDLPAPFALDLAAQTTSGQVVWGDAIYFRDLGSPDYDRMWPYEITRERVMKLACLFDLHELPDCAAELLINHAQFLEPGLRGELLDLLATGEPGSHAAHVAAFVEDFTAFYPSRLAPRDAAPSGTEADGRKRHDAAAAKQLQHLRNRLASLTAKNASLRERLKRRGDRIDKLTKRIERLEPEP